MIAEPYICIKGPNSGKILWATNQEDCQDPRFLDGSKWQSYADFEREKLRELGKCDGRPCEITIECDGLSKDGYFILCAGNLYCSQELLGYGRSDFDADSESSRLLKRAEFLKAVCEKEGVEWLPTVGTDRCVHFGDSFACGNPEHCKCPCHKPKSIDIVEALTKGVKVEPEQRLGE